MTIDYSRQTDIFNPKDQKLKIIILGAGSIGSFTCLNLCKLGFNNIEVFDFDKIGMENISNQFFRVEDIGKFKVDALQEIVKSFSGIEIIPKNVKVDKDTEFNVGMDNIFILTFDTLENRKMFFNIIKNFKCTVIDARLGGEEYNIQVIDTYNKDQMKKWEQSLNIIPTQLPCGMKSVVYSNLSISSEICNIIKKINNNQQYPKKIIRNMQRYFILNDLEKMK